MLTVDILAELGRRKRGQVLIGFAVQDEEARERAERKLRDKNLDAIVLNSPAALGSGDNQVQILRRGQGWQELARADKAVVAEEIVALAESLWQNR